MFILHPSTEYNGVFAQHVIVGHVGEQNNQTLFWLPLFRTPLFLVIKLTYSFQEGLIFKWIIPWHKSSQTILIAQETIITIVLGYPVFSLWDALYYNIL
jgi:hypothetical protein